MKKVPQHSRSKVASAVPVLAESTQADSIHADAESQQQPQAEQQFEDQDVAADHGAAASLKQVAEVALQRAVAAEARASQLQAEIASLQGQLQQMPYSPAAAPDAAANPSSASDTNQHPVADNNDNRVEEVEMLKEALRSAAARIHVTEQQCQQAENSAEVQAAEGQLTAVKEQCEQAGNSAEARAAEAASLRRKLAEAEGKLTVIQDLEVCAGMVSPSCQCTAPVQHR